MKEPENYRNYDGNVNTDLNENDIIQAQNSVLRDQQKYPEIIKGTNDKVETNSQRSSLIKAFSFLDKDKTGIINAEETREVLKTVLEVDPEKVDALLVRAGYEGNGYLNYNDLCYALLE